MANLGSVFVWLVDHELGLSLSSLNLKRFGNEFDRLANRIQELGLESCGKIKVLDEPLLVSFYYSHQQGKKFLKEDVSIEISFSTQVSVARGADKKPSRITLNDLSSGKKYAIMRDNVFRAG